MQVQPKAQHGEHAILYVGRDGVGHLWNIDDDKWMPDAWTIGPDGERQSLPWQAYIKDGYWTDYNGPARDYP